MEEVAVGFRGIATLRPLLPDEISAMVVLERHQGSPVTEIKFLEHSEYSPEQLDEFLLQGWFPVEVGEINYKSDGAGSATEAVVKNLGLDQSNLNSGETKIIELMNRRNQNGYLNQNHMSIPRIFGNLYDLGYDEMDLIERFKEVVRAFIDDINRKTEGTPPAQEDSLMRGQFPDLFQKIEFREETQETKKCQFAPLTPDRYLRDLWRLGVPVAEIGEKVSFWIGAWKRFQEEYRKAKELWKNGDVERIVFSVDGFSGAAVETDNRFIAKVAAPTVDILINRRPDGHGAVMTNGRNVSALSQELSRLESGRWYYHQPAGHLINGGRSVASGLNLTQLIELAQKFPPK